MAVLVNNEDVLEEPGMLSSLMRSAACQKSVKVARETVRVLLSQRHRTPQPASELPG